MIKTNKDLVNAALEVVSKYKTLYVMGCFGAPMNDGNKHRYVDAYSYNHRSDRREAIMTASTDTFGFDCVCLIKGLLWGWSGNLNDAYGGASYASHGVPDINADGMIKACSNVSTDFSTIVPGCVVWMDGHIGIYIGDDKVIECTPRWADGVQISGLWNTDPNISGNARKWTKHGRLPYITYVDIKPDEAKTIDELAHEVIQGKWGNNPERESRITEAGYDYAAVQRRVNELLTDIPEKSIDTIAHEVIQGKWGNGSERESKLVAAGYNYDDVQKRVNELLGG